MPVVKHVRRRCSTCKFLYFNSKKWVCIGDWNSVDDLRRCLANPEFIELKRRAPATVLSKDTIVVTAAYGGKPGAEGEVLVGNKDNLRQRGSTNYGTVSS